MWDVTVEVWGPIPRLAGAWARLDAGPWAIAKPLGLRVEDFAFDYRDECGGLRAWVILRLAATDEQRAVTQGERFFDSLMASGRGGAAHASTGPSITARRAVRGQELEGVLGELRPDCFEPSTRPVAWTTWTPRDNRTIEIHWKSGSEQVAAVDVDEADAAITVTVHEQRGPALRPDGSEVAELLRLRSRSVTVELRAPVAGREVIDGFSGERRGEAAVTQAADA